MKKLAASEEKAIADAELKGEISLRIEDSVNTEIQKLDEELIQNAKSAELLGALFKQVRTV
jgi:hypothetical protein